MLILLANTLLALALLWAAHLRETPLFWRNAGGYSVGFREFVRVGFPVFFVLDVLLVGASTYVLIRARRTVPSVVWTGLCVAVVQGMLLTAVAGFAVQNNLSNLWHGRPLHWHSDR